MDGSLELQISPGVSILSSSHLPECVIIQFMFIQHSPRGWYFAGCEGTAGRSAHGHYRNGTHDDNEEAMRGTVELPAVLSAKTEVQPFAGLEGSGLWNCKTL